MGCAHSSILGLEAFGRGANFPISNANVGFLRVLIKQKHSIVSFRASLTPCPIIFFKNV